VTAHWTRKARHRLQQLYDYIAKDQPENARQLVEHIGLRYHILGDLLDVMLGIVGDKIIDGSGIGLGRVRPDYQDSISRFKSSLVVV